MYQSPSISDYRNIKGNNVLFLSVSRSFIKNKLEVMLDCRDVFNSEKNSFDYIWDNISYVSENHPDSRYIRLMLSYSFSSKNVKHFRLHSAQSESESRMGKSK